MPIILPSKRLLRVSVALRETLLNHKEGVSLEHDSGRTIDQLVLKVAADRWRFAAQHRAIANRLMRTTPPLYRTAISRYYYAMYHALRAAVFTVHFGDDNQEHRELPLHIPADFDPGAGWQQIMKDARLIRNKADYDPYPISNQAWRKHAIDLRTDAIRLLRVSRAYLQNKGCHI